jgi:hypothetical protein
MELMDAIGEGPVAIDTVVFIYFIEQNPRFDPLLQSLFARIDSGRLTAVTSAIHCSKRWSSLIAPVMPISQRSMRRFSQTVED